MRKNLSTKKIMRILGLEKTDFTLDEDGYLMTAEDRIDDLINMAEDLVTSYEEQYEQKISLTKAIINAYKNIEKYSEFDIYEHVKNNIHIEGCCAITNKIISDAEADDEEENV